MLTASYQKVIPLAKDEEDREKRLEKDPDGESVSDDESSSSESSLDDNEGSYKDVEKNDNEQENADKDEAPIGLRKKSYFEKLFSSLSKLTYDDIKQYVRYLLEQASCNISFTFEDILMMLTIYILFADDIKILSTSVEADKGFSISYAICFFIFIFEFILNSWSKSTVHSVVPLKYEGYLFSFFWWLDIISILSIMPDIDFIGKPTGLMALTNAVSGGASYTQAGRVVRLVRLVRLVRIYRIASEKRARKEREEELMELVRVNAISYEELEKQRLLFTSQQSKLGVQLSDSTTRRVVVIILILLIIVPLLIYSPANTGPEFAVELLHDMVINENITTASKQAFFDIYVSTLDGYYTDRFVDYALLSPEFGADPVINYKSNLASLRSYVKVVYEYTDRVAGATFLTDIIYNFNSVLRNQSMFAIITTVFVGIMMVGGAVIFSNDAQKMVIAPIERMMTLVEAVAKNPLANLSDNKQDDDKAGSGGKASAGDYETKLLESTIGKITGLLRVGFGEAGAGIISANLSGTNATINPLLPGVRIYAIFGFCDIHHFEDVNQKLTNDVLTFVNTIAEIVHGSVHTWSGQCNKNLGNAFVIVWRIGDEETLIAQAGHHHHHHHHHRQSAARQSFTAIDSSHFAGSPPKSSTEGGGGGGGLIAKKTPTVDLRRVPGVDMLADHALIGYLKIIAEINRSRKVLSYRKEPRLYDKEHKKEFKVRMGFGLHAGWAIEGAVGSLQKVDATYLSPHVNMAARLETSSRQYGVPLLASQDFYDLLSQDAQTQMRRLDVVTVKGSEVPIGIYTYDCLQEQEFRDHHPSKGNASRQSMAQHQLQQAISSALDHSPALGPPASPSPGPTPTTVPGGPDAQSRKSSVSSTERPAVFMTPDASTADIFQNDYDLLTLRAHVTDEFQELFKEGVRLYLAGEWAEARVKLERTDALMLSLAPPLQGDGPSKTLLSYMASFDWKPPSDWKGFRPLTSK